MVALSPAHKLRQRIETDSAWLPAALALVVPFGAYLATATPGLTALDGGADAGDLVTAISTLGVPHPTGYPLYVLLGRIFLLLPFPEIAFRVTFMSVVFASLGVFLLYHAALVLLARLARAEASRARWSALAAALVFAFSPFYWSQATVAEVYTVAAAIAAALLLVTLSLPRPGEGRADRRVLLLGLLAGLGLVSHATLVFLLLVPLTVILTSRLLTPKVLLASLAAAAVGLLPLLYLPLRAGQAPTSWGDPSTLEGFIAHITASQYRAMVAGVSQDMVLTRLALLVPIFTQQLFWIGMPLVIVGGLRLWRRDRVLTASGAMVICALSVFASAYSGVNSEVYLVPALMLFALALAVGLAEPPARLQGLTRSPRWLLVVPALACVATWPLVDVSRDRKMEEDGRAVMLLAPPEAVILTSTDEDTFALWYLRYVVGLRPDTVIVAEGLRQFPWYRANLRKFEGIDVNSVSFEGRPVLRAKGGTLVSQ